ncbi:MAG: hypothetical protein JW760_12260 [Spirochaetales bacterium]|nr:hypothetical protein [Spirochaetales bacterium]
MFQLLSPDHRKSLILLVGKISDSPRSDIRENLTRLIERVRSDIPEKKRISLGRYSIVRDLGLEMYPLLAESGVDAFAFGVSLFEKRDADPFVRSLGVQLVSIHGLEPGSLDEVLEVFRRAAADEDWLVRECSAGFVRKLVKEYPEELRRWYLAMVRSEDPLKRRFASESLRPVADNRWFRNNSDYVFSIIEHLFTEPDAYPRTSAGNALSDWMRIGEERTRALVERLAKSGNRNSYWIAYRACRNLVKKDPLWVLDTLGVEEYKYKDRFFARKEEEQS